MLAGRRALRPSAAAWTALLPLAGLGCGDDGELDRLVDVGSMVWPDVGFADLGAGSPDSGAEGDVGVRADASSRGDTGALADAGASDTGGAMDAGSAGRCPPTGPFGTQVGDTFPDFQLPDCDGQLHNLHDACGRKASYFFVYADW